MSVKQVQIIVPGGDLSIHVPLEPNTTVAEAIDATGIENKSYGLSSADGQKLFQPPDKLYPLVNDGDILYLNPRSVVGWSFSLSHNGIIILLVSLAGMLTLFITWIICNHLNQKQPVCSNTSPENSYKHPALSYSQHAGWRQADSVYTGEYQAGNYFLPGRIKFRSRWDYRFDILAPERLIHACGKHRRCFTPLRKSHPRGQRWYQVHFNSRPHNVSSGILAIQQLLAQAAVHLERDLV